MVLNSQAVIDFRLIPGLKMNHQIQLGLHLDRPQAKELPHVNHADTAQLDVMTNNLRCSADELIGDQPQFYCIVRYTPCCVTQGASVRFRYSMVWLVNSTVVS